MVPQRDLFVPRPMSRIAQLNLRVRPGLKATLAKLAEQDRRTLSAYVEKVLEDYVTMLKRRKPKPLTST
jgi:predicted HicB family RNase H-like nuclease